MFAMGQYADEIEVNNKCFFLLQFYIRLPLIIVQADGDVSKCEGAVSAILDVIETGRKYPVKDGPRTSIEVSVPRNLYR